MLCALFVLFLVWAYAVALSSPAAGVFHDDGIYLVTARALAEDQGYHIISLPQSPPQTKYPILFPFLLSLVWRLAPSFPDNLLLLRMVPLGATVAWLWLSWLLLRKCGASGGAAAAVLLLTAVSPWVVFLGTALLSETLFAALLTGSLLLLTQAGKNSGPTGRTCALAGLLAGASFLTRTVGIAVVASGLVWLLANRRRIGALAFGLSAALCVLPWVAWVLANSGTNAEAYYSASNYGSWNVVFHYAWREKCIVVVTNVIQLIAAPSPLWGVDFRLWLLVPAALLAASASYGAWRTRMQPVTWFVITYVAIVILWVWPPLRFLVAILPLWLWLVSVAIRRLPTAVAAGIVATLLATSSATLFSSVAQSRSVGLMWFEAESAEDWHRLSNLFEWIRRATPSDSILVGNLDPTYFLYTGRKAVRAFDADPYVLFYSGQRTKARPLGSVTDLRGRLLTARADYCVLSPARGFGESPYFHRLLDELHRDEPTSLSMAAADEAAGYVVYHIDRPTLAAERR